MHARWTLARSHSASCQMLSLCCMLKVNLDKSLRVSLLSKSSDAHGSWTHCQQHWILHMLPCSALKCSTVLATGDAQQVGLTDTAIASCIFDKQRRHAVALSGHVCCQSAASACSYQRAAQPAAIYEVPCHKGGHGMGSCK